MITILSPFNRNRLVAAVSIVAVLTVIIAATAFLPPGRTLAQAGEPDRAEPGLVSTSQPPSPPPALQLNPPAATPEPGAVEASSGPPVGSSDLEIVQFRPDTSLVRGEVPPSTAAEKPAGAADSGSLKPPAGEGGGPREAYQSPGVAGLLAPLDWTALVYEDFEGVFPGAWILEDFGPDGYERTWGDTNYMSQLGSWSAWPAKGGADGLDPYYYYYSDNLDSWMEYGPFDFSNMADVYVSFGLWYDTEPDFDWMRFCVSTDFVNYDCYRWSGYSDGWIDQAFFLTDYAGYPQVWLAWVFQSDASISAGYDGPFVDEIYILGDYVPIEGQLIQNGSFEEGGDSLIDWSTDSWNSVSALEDQIGQLPSLRPDADRESSSDSASPLREETGILDIGVTTDTSVDGQYSAFLSRSGGFGGDFLYQTMFAPSNVTDLVLNFWSRIETNETNFNTDVFCVGLWSPDLNDLLVDLGCLDVVDTTGLWQEVVHTLTYDEVVQVAGQPVALVFELYNDGAAGSGTTLWIDAVQVQALGGDGGDPLDLNEPNDTWDSATVITCDTTITGTVGDALGGYDVDLFELINVPEGRIDIDITADTQSPPSALDSVVGLWDDGTPNPNLLDWNDDDGVSFDSYIVYTNTANNATFYVSVESYSGYGSLDSFYDLTVQCAGSGSGPPPPETEVTPADDTWTVMLYLNAEDPSFAPILTQYRTDIESFIGSKSDFLTVTILYDGPGNSDTVRYVVQPNGVYTSHENRWSLGELNVGAPDTLEHFVSWSMDEYPAENYYLAIDDHGDGVYGISFDSTSGNDQLTPPELYSALKSATHNGARKIDIFDYEACLMGLAENAYDVREWVDYVVFFEQISWGINTYPVYFGDLAATDEPEDVGRRIVDRYYTGAHAANGGRGYPHTISLIDTSKMEAVSDAVTSFGNTIKATDTQAQKDAINSARDNSQAFAADMDATNAWRAEYIDLWDLADKASGLAAAQAAAVKSAVDAAVVYERHASGRVSGYVWDHSDAHGLSIYYPPSTSSSAFSSYVAPSLYQMSHDGTWDEFLAWAVPSGNRRGMSASRSEIKLTGDDAYIFKYVYLPMTIRME
jgi:hypothetical protein